MKRLVVHISALMLTLTTFSAQASPVLMSSDWGRLACRAWNAQPVLTKGLAESEWVINDRGRGHKVIHLYRSECTESPRLELRISEKDGQAKCVYGGRIETDLDLGVDYILHADTEHWREMGRGEYGPIWAIATFKLSFTGPELEALANIQALEQFLRLIGRVPATHQSCP